MSTSLKELNQLNLWEFKIDILERSGTLVIVGSTDLGYYHLAEIRFVDVDYLGCPTYFLDAQFRLATRKEIKDLRGAVGIERGMKVFCIETDEGKFFIVASKVECEIGTVYYYKCERLQQGEKIAPWVQ